MTMTPSSMYSVPPPSCAAWTHVPTCKRIAAHLRLCQVCGRPLTGSMLSEPRLACPYSFRQHVQPCISSVCLCDHECRQQLFWSNLQSSQAAAGGRGRRSAPTPHCSPWPCRVCSAQRQPPDAAPCSCAGSLHLAFQLTPPHLSGSFNCHLSVWGRKMQTPAYKQVKLVACCGCSEHFPTGFAVGQYSTLAVEQHYLDQLQSTCQVW